MDLMLTYVEEGVQFVNVFGVIDDDSMTASKRALDSLCELFKTGEG